MNAVASAPQNGVAASASVAPDVFRALERRLVFEGAKWDTQVGDVAVLAPWVLRLDRPTWRALAASAEALHHEVAAVEQALLQAPQALPLLGLPRALSKVFQRRGPTAASPALARLQRVDFHPTEAGWCASEINADVPGGFAEASPFTQAMAEATGSGVPCGDPAGALVDAIVARSPRDGSVFALVHATAWQDDRQVAELFRRALAHRGVEAIPIAPDHLRWRADGTAEIGLAGPLRGQRVWGLWRFFPAEWLPNLPSRTGWRHFLVDGRVPAINPGSALLIQSKRWPLAAAALGVPTPEWHRVAAATRAPDRSTATDAWVLKPAFGRVGEGVAVAGVTRPVDLAAARSGAWWWPRQWVAQARFASRAVPTPEGPMHLCVGVYTLDGRAIGAYARASARALIDGSAREVAVLTEEAG